MSGVPPRPDVSVIVVGRNEGDLLAGCLDSLGPGLAGLSFDAWYVDNGSTEDVAAMVRRRCPDVRVIENGENLGFARANNRALEEARGRYLLLLNNDARLVAGEMPRLVAWMDDHPGVGAAGCRLESAQGRVQHSVHPFPDLATELLSRGLLSWLFPRRYPSKRTRWDGPADVDAVLGACLLVRREVLGDVGLLDGDYFFYLEETDWCYRMRATGWKVVYHPGVRAIHLAGGTVARFPGRGRVELYRSRYRFFSKFRGPWVVAVLGAGLVLRLLAVLALHAAATLLTLGLVRGIRTRVAVGGYLVVWHAGGRPRDWGLEGLR